ncbi:MAG: ImmA/IrrE family metallo-endopeptidase [Bryobacteraceae bacterium]
MARFFRSLRWLIALATVLTAAAQQSNLPTAQEINSVLGDLSAITGFKIYKQLPFQMITRDQVNQFLKEQIKQTVKPAEIRAEEVTLKKFGFVPQDFDLKKTTIDLLTEQAAAFYDFHRKKLFISDWAAENMREAALVHELGHALADQNFPIQKFLAKNSDDSEESLARETVVEGQASWLMIEYALRREGKSLADPVTAEAYLKDDAGDQAAGEGEYPVFSNAPLYLKRTLMFPYEEGQKFQQAVFMKDGRDAFSQVFRKPPVTTSQVIHPERYFSGVTYKLPSLPKPLPHTKTVVEGTMGELDHRILLTQFIDGEAAGTLGPKLKGSAYRIDELKSDRRLMLVYASDWDSVDAAGQYFGDYQKVLRAKWKKIEVSVEDAQRFSGKSEDGYFSVALVGSEVLSEEGFAQPL